MIIFLLCVIAFILLFGRAAAQSVVKAIAIFAIFIFLIAILGS